MFPSWFGFLTEHSKPKSFQMFIKSDEKKKKRIDKSNAGSFSQRNFSCIYPSFLVPYSKVLLPWTRVGISLTCCLMFAFFAPGNQLPASVKSTIAKLISDMWVVYSLVCKILRVFKILKLVSIIISILVKFWIRCNKEEEIYLRQFWNLFRLFLSMNHIF